MELFGKYRLGDRIARGGMAEVYHAQVVGAAGFARKIAVKRILPELVEDTEFLEMFTEEAKLAAQLDHPNVVQIFDFDHVDDSFYIAMEYVRGADLSKLIAAARRKRELLNPAVVVFVIGEVLAGLHYAHSLTDDGHHLGLVHRDISPANILLSYTGAVKLADFGIAKAATSMVHTQGGVLKGKVPYMSPEQAAGEPLDRRSDLFSVGIVLYQALVGKRPFTGSNPGMLFNKLCRGEFLPPRRVVSTVTQELEDVIEKALCVDLDGRYQSAKEFRADLRKTIEPQPTRDDLERCLARLIPERLTRNALKDREISTVTDDARRKAEERRPSPLSFDDRSRDGEGQLLLSPPDLVDSSGLPYDTDEVSPSGATLPSKTKAERVSARPGEFRDDAFDSINDHDAPSDTDAEKAFVEAKTERLEPSPDSSLESAETNRVVQKRPRRRRTEPDASRDSDVIEEEAQKTIRGVMPPPRSWWRRRFSAVAVAGSLIIAALIIGSMALLGRDVVPLDTPSTPPGDVPTFTVLGRRSPDQWTELRKNGLDEALESRGLKLHLLEYNAYPKLLEILRTSQVDLVNAPLSLARALTEQELIVPIDRVAREQLKAVRARFTVPALKVGVVDTTLGTRMAFLPEYLEAHVIVYRISKVTLACQRWQDFRPAIEAALAAVNGRGLPVGYELEGDPASWDEFDLFVAGYTWAHLDEGSPQPRLALRSRGYWPSVDALVERAILHGQTQTTLVQGQPLLDVLTWLALHHEHDLERPEVWAHRSANRPSGTSLTHWIAWDSIYLARVNQFRCAELRGYLRDHHMSFGVEDLAFAPLPSGVSVQLDADGRPLRSGNNVGLVNAWLWAIPRSAHDKRRSLEVVLDLVDVPHQTHFANRNCWIPTNSAVDTSDSGDLEPFCRRAMAPGAETLGRAWFVYNPPNLEALDEALERYDRLWTDVFVKSGYRPEGDVDGSPISLERLDTLMKQHIPQG